MQSSFDVSLSPSLLHPACCLSKLLLVSSSVEELNASERASTKVVVECTGTKR